MTTDDFTAMLAEAMDETTTNNADTTKENTMNTITAADVVLPEGIVETPALRPVYAALINGATTAKEIVDVTGLILPKVRAALGILKGAGIATASEQTKPGQVVTWSLVGSAPVNNDDTNLFGDMLSLDAPAEYPTMAITPEQFAADFAADVAAMDADIAAGAEIDAAVDATGHMPGNDDTDAPTDAVDGPADTDTDNATTDAPAAVTDAPTAKPKRVRLLAVYTNDAAPSAAGSGKITPKMQKFLDWMIANPGNQRISAIAKGVGTQWTADVLKTMRRIAALDTRVTQVEGEQFATFVFTPVADDVTADDAVTVDATDAVDADA